MLDMKFHGKPVYDEKYIKTKITTFNGVVNTVLSGNKIPTQSIQHICLAVISIDSVMRIDKKTALKFI